jgi:hypothetical protein
MGKTYTYKTLGKTPNFIKFFSKYYKYFMVKLNQVLWVYFEDQYIINISYVFILRKNITYVLNFKNKLVLIG